ncbi:polyprenyl synthetase family protein [Nocardia heshunensis]
MVDVTTLSIEDHRPEALLEAAAAVWLPVLRQVVATAPEPLARMSGYHFGWWDADGTAVAARPGGKGFRGGLAVCAGVACGASPGRAARAGAAVELLHNFTLVHDDLMDRDRLRRGRATVWSVWGADTAVLIGDGLHALAIQTLAGHQPSTTAVAMVMRLEAAAMELCRGQYEDLAFETQATVEMADYTRMVTGKTGALMGAACALGGLAAGAETSVVMELEAFGRALGVGFQIVDDLLGIWGKPAVTGKPVGADLARRKRSLPVLVALAGGGDIAAELAELYRPGPMLTCQQIARATALLEASGAREITTAEADRRIAQALAALPDHISTADLRMLAQAVGRRGA